GHRVNAGALVDLDEVDPTGRDVDDGFSRAGDRIGGLGGPQDFRTAGLLDNDGAHAWPPRIRGHRARATGQTLLLRPFPLPAVQLVHGKVVEDDHDVVASADSPAGQHAGLGGVFAVIGQRVGVDRLQDVLPVEPQVEGDRVGFGVQFAGEVERVDRRFLGVPAGSEETGDGFGGDFLQVGGALFAAVAADLGCAAVHAHRGGVVGDVVSVVVVEAVQPVGSVVRSGHHLGGGADAHLLRKSGGGSDRDRGGPGVPVRAERVAALVVARPGEGVLRVEVVASPPVLVGEVVCVDLHAFGHFRGAEQHQSADDCPG